MFTYLNAMMLGCFNFLKCLISVSFCSLTFLMATSSARNLPKKTAPWAPLPSHCSSEISSKGTSQVSRHTSKKHEEISVRRNQSIKPLGRHLSLSPRMISVLCLWRPVFGPWCSSSYIHIYSTVPTFYHRNQAVQKSLTNSSRKYTSLTVLQPHLHR